MPSYYCRLNEKTNLFEVSDGHGKISAYFVHERHARTWTNYLNRKGNLSLREDY